MCYSSGCIPRITPTKPVAPDARGRHAVGVVMAGRHCIPKSLYGDIAWLVLISSLGWWASQRLVAAQLDSIGGQC